MCRIVGTETWRGVRGCITRDSRTFLCLATWPFLLRASSASRGRSRRLNMARARASVRRASAATGGKDFRGKGGGKCSRAGTGGQVFFFGGGRARKRGGPRCFPAFR